jgi:hypothetical protein
MWAKPCFPQRQKENQLSSHLECCRNAVGVVMNLKTRESLHYREFESAIVIGHCWGGKE